MTVAILFYQNGELSSFLEKRKIDLKNEVEQFEPNYILNVSEEDLKQYLISKYSLQTPKIYEDKIYVYEPTDVDIDVSKDPLRFFAYMMSEPFYVKGVRVTIAIPFEGDSELLHYQPSTFTLNPPRGKVVGNEINLVYEMVEHDLDKLKQLYENDLNKIKNYLGFIEQDIKTFNHSLNEFVRQLISQRKNKILDDLG